MGKKKPHERRVIVINFSTQEVKAIYEACLMLDQDIYEFDVYAPGKVISCTYSAIAKLKNLDLTKSEDDEKTKTFPLTLNELNAAQYALDYVVDELTDDSSMCEYVDDSLSNPAELTVLADKIRGYLEASKNF